MSRPDNPCSHRGLDASADGTALAPREAMSRKLLWLGLVAGLSVVAALLWTQRYGACAHPVAYRVGTVD